VTLEADILFSIVANETDAGDYAKDVRTTKVENYARLTTGSGNNQAQVVWSDSRTAANGQTDTIDMSALTDERGTITVQGIKLIYFKNTGANAIYFNPNVPNAWTGLFSSDEGSPQWFTLPVGTTAVFSRPGSGNLSGGQIAAYAGSGAISYDVLIIARGTIT
jgi:hypothetical protein